MSYILDALRKSEQQRTRGAAPSLLVVPVADAPPRRPMTLWYGLLAIILLAAGIAIGTLRPWRTEASQPPTIAVRTQPAVTPTPATPPAPVPENAAKDEQRPVVTIAPPASAPTIAPATAPVAPATAPGLAPAAVPGTTPAPVTSDAGKALAPVATSDGATKARSAVVSAPASAVLPESTSVSPPKAVPVAADPTAPAAPKPAEPVAQRPPIAFAELPLAVQQEMPKVTVQFHLYSGNPKDRLAGINDRMLREGDSIQPGLVLEQITPDGMILTFKGYRFLRGAR